MIKMAWLLQKMMKESLFEGRDVSGNSLGSPSARGKNGDSREGNIKYKNLLCILRFSEIYQRESMFGKEKRPSYFEHLADELKAFLIPPHE